MQIEQLLLYVNRYDSTAWGVGYLDVGLLPLM
jgi:hypothetical protein